MREQGNNDNIICSYYPCRYFNMPKAQKPNILFFFTDQQRVDTLGCYGAGICQTPTLDAIADEGVCFERAYTPTAICTPARASLLTGLWPHQHQLLANHERNVGYQTELGKEHIPFSRYLREVGYNVGSIGKWHVGETRGPEEFGFDGIHYPGWGDPVTHPDYLDYLKQHNLPEFKASGVIRGVFPNGQPAIPIGGYYDGPVEGTWSYFIAERTIELMRKYADDLKSHDQPFYLGCQFYGPHLPYVLPREYADMYDPDLVKLPANACEAFENKPRVQQNYCRHWAWDTLTEAEQKKLTAMSWGYVTLIDEQIGRVMDEASRLGLLDDTAIFFTSDHGEFSGSHRMNDKGPAMYEEIYRVPFIGKLPVGEQGGRNTDFVNLLDLTATFVDLATGTVPDHFEGRSLVPLLNGNTVSDWPKEVFAQYHGHHFPYPQRMIRTERYKLIINPADINELYDLATDPDELVNLIDDPCLSDIRAELMDRLYQKLIAAGDNFYHWMTSTCEVGSSAENAQLDASEST